MSIDPEHPLALGARMVDDLGDAVGYVGALGEMGLELDAVEYVARQRAYRSWLLLKGGPELVAEYVSGRAMPPMSTEDEHLIDLLTATSASAIVLGWTARGVAERRKEQSDGN